MKLTAAQAEIIARSEMFAPAIREALDLIARMSPLLWNLSLARQRDRARVVTRNKQRRSW